MKEVQFADIYINLEESKAMIILITGASHTGKTLLAQKLLEKYHYPYLSIDHLKMGLIRSGQTDLTPYDDDKLTDYLWSIIKEMIKTAIENKQNLIVEGYHFRELPVGTRFRIGDVLLEMTQIGKECHSHCQIYKVMGDCIMPREGVFARVLHGGTIHVGDEITQIPTV